MYWNSVIFCINYQYLKNNLRRLLCSDLETDDDSDKETDKEQSNTLREYSLSNSDEYNFSNYDNECKGNI